MRLPARTLHAVTAIALIVFVAGAAGAQEGGRSRVRVARLSVPENAPQLEAIAGIVSETVALTLRLLGRYEVARSDAGAEVDSVVGGTVTREESGAIRFELEVRHGITGEQILETVHVAPSLFDVFNVADEATVALLEGIADRRILFGELRITPDRPDDRYTVVLNDESIASTAGEYANERVIEGVYELAIVQGRPTGPEVIASRSIEVVAAAPTTVDVTIPIIRDDEINLLRAQLPAAGDPTRAPEFADYWAAGGRSAADRLARVIGEGVFPAKDAVARYYEDSDGLAARTASSWTADSDEPGVIVVPARATLIDGDAAEWRGVPALALEPNAPGRAAPTARVALDAEGEKLYILFAALGDQMGPGATFRVVVAPDGSSFPAAGALELDLEPDVDRFVAFARLWSSSSRDDYEPLELDARIVPGESALEAVLDVEGLGLDRPFSLGVAILEDDEPIAASTPRWLRAVPSLRQPASTGLPLLTALAESDVTPVSGRGAAVLGEPLIGSFHETAHASIISVDDSWRPQLSVVDNGTSVRLHIGLDGVPEADSVTVDGPEGSGIVALELEEDGRYTGVDGDGYYSARLARPESIEPGDVYRFFIERAGFAMEVSAAVRPLPGTLAEDFAVTASPNGYEFSWEPVADAVERTLVIADGALATPYARSWRYSMELAADANAITLPPYRLGASGQVRAHLLSRDANGNLWWNVTTFDHGPIFADAEPIPRKTIDVDGDPRDWEDMPDFGNASSLRGWNDRNILSIEHLYLAADDDYLYWAIDSATASLLSEAIPQLQIYNSYADSMQKDGALLAILRDNETGSELVFDAWNNASRRIHYEEDFFAVRTAEFAEMRIPRDALRLDYLEMNIAVWERDGSDRAFNMRNFRVVMPE